MSTVQTDFVTTNIVDRILTITFNRPEKKNAITRDMYQVMADAITASNGDPSVRVILFEGTDGCFTSGNDLKDFMSDPNTGGESSVGKFLEAVVRAEKPIVAAVTGIAVGIGTTLLLHSDLVIASESAKFHMPFVNLGLVPEFGSSMILPQLMGHRRASELILLGKPFGPDEALELGIINKVQPADQVIEAARTMATELTQRPPAALRAAKKLMRSESMEAVLNQIQLEAEQFATCLTGSEAMEAMQAFMQKRKPDFSSFE
jgi:enoyl-CoA hydratase/carnithine racemase